jgi:hypothetical protein
MQADDGKKEVNELKILKGYGKKSFLSAYG